ncbi:MAG: MATE family efflux transporter, partial [Clostridia bacterium]
AKHYAIKLIKVTYLLMGISNLLLFLFAQPLSSIFSLSPEGIAAATEVLRFFAISASIFWTASFTLPNALRAAGDAKFTMTVSVFSMWVFRIGASYLLVYGFHMGLLGIWVAMAIDWVARAVLFSWRYRSGKWLTKKIV